MTGPVAGQTQDGMLGQILLKLGEMGAQLAVMDEKLKSVADHEQRLRALEQFKFKLVGGVVTISVLTSGLGTWIGVIVTHK